MSIVFGAEDVRQYVYCPRIIYFRYVLRTKAPRTAKMKKGTEKHSKVVKRQEVAMKRLERGMVGERTSKDDYSYREIWLVDDELGVKARVDLMQISRGKQKEPVCVITEIKTGRAPTVMSKSHLLQLSTQAILVERQFRMAVTQVRIHYQANNKEVVEELTDGLRTEALETLRIMRQLVINEWIPNPTPQKKKCRDCEFWRSCQRA